MTKICIVKDCGKKRYSRGFCRHHYGQDRYLRKREDLIRYVSDYHRRFPEKYKEYQKKYHSEHKKNDK